jgi:hypothetical protein
MAYGSAGGVGLKRSIVGAFPAKRSLSLNKVKGVGLQKIRGSNKMTERHLECVSFANAQELRSWRL